MGAPNMSEKEWNRDVDAKGREIFKLKVQQTSQNALSQLAAAGKSNPEH